MHETLFVVKIKRLCHFEQKLNTWDRKSLWAVPYQVELHSFHKCDLIENLLPLLCFSDSVVLYLGRV